MDGAKKTAVLLLSLEQEVAAILLRRLPREQVEQVTLAIANSESVTRHDQESILIEFKAAFVTRPLLEPAGPETARQLLEKSLDQADVEPLRTRIEEQAQAGEFAFLHRRHADDIRRLISSEHPQTIAVVVAQLPPELSAQVLSGFAADVQADVLGRVARLGPTSAVVLDEIARLLKERIGSVPVRSNGLQHAADVLRETPHGESRTLLEMIDRSDMGLGESLRGSLFPFHEIEAFDDATLRVILQKSDQCPWSMALKGASEILRQRVLGLLPVKLAAALTEEMNSLGPVRLSEITAAQQPIVDIVLGLEANNEITRPRNTNRPRRLRQANSSPEPLTDRIVAQHAAHSP